MFRSVNRVAESWADMLATYIITKLKQKHQAERHGTLTRYTGDFTMRKCFVFLGDFS